MAYGQMGMYGQMPYGAYMGQQMQQPQPMQQNMISGRMVTSREEALGVPVDFMAGMTVLPDMSHGRIYVKIFDKNTGGANVVEFVPAKAEEETPSAKELEKRVQKLEDVIAQAQRRGAITASRRVMEDE